MANNGFHHPQPPLNYPMVIVDPPSRPQNAHPSSHFPTPPPVGPQYQLPPQQTFSDTSEMDIKPIITPQLPPDLSILLMSLANQYISAGRKLAPLIAHNQHDVDPAKYHELISAGLRCIECSLLHLRFRGRPPRQEALLQLKYASLLYEETINYGAIEELLSKSIMLCDQNRFYDLKYSMQHLLIRVMSKTNLRTALKQIDRLISDCETLQHYPWIYAFHFLKASLLLEQHTLRDLHAASLSLRRVSDLARQRLDAEIGIATSLLQSLIHLRSHREDSTAEAQRSLAGARARLSNYSTNDLPQLFVLLHQLELVSTLNPYDHQQAQAKLQAMQHLMDKELSGIKWRRDRALVLRINPSGMDNLLVETGGIFDRDDSRGVGLVFSWTGRIEAYALAFLLSAVASFQKNARDHKCEVYLREALKSTSDDHIVQDAPQSVPLGIACEKANALRETRRAILIQLAFASAFRSDWTASRTFVKRTEEIMVGAGTSSQTISTLCDYLHGVTCQGLGEGDAALSWYQRPSLVLDIRDAHTLSPSRMLAILAALNSLLIIHNPTHPQHGLVPTLLDKLRFYFPTANHGASQGPSLGAQHADLFSAFSLVMAILQQRPAMGSANMNGNDDSSTKSVLASKQALQAALNGAKTASNPLLKALCLSYMHHLFFAGIYDEQAERLAQAGVIQASEAGNQMWLDVAKEKLNRVKGQPQIQQPHPLP